MADFKPRLTLPQMDRKSLSMVKLQSPENIAMDCNSFRLHTEEDTEIIAKGHMIDARKETRIF